MDDLIEIIDDDRDSVESIEKQPQIRKLARFLPELKAKHLLYTSVFGFIMGCILTLSLVFALSNIINRDSKPIPTDPTIYTVPDDDSTLTISMVQDVLKPTAALITNQYHYTAADIYDDYKKFFGHNLPFTNSKAVFTFKGTMSIGLDLQAVEYVVDNEKKSIHISLSEIGILSHDIDLSSFRFPFEAESIFNPKEMSDYVGALDKLKSTQADLVLNDEEYMAYALHNTQEVIRVFLANSELTKDYTVTFATQEAP